MNTRADGALVVPSAEGMVDILSAIKAAQKVGKWTMIAPDGRVWMNADPVILFAALAAIMRGEQLRFGDN